MRTWMLVLIGCLVAGSASAQGRSPVVVSPRTQDAFHPPQATFNQYVRWLGDLEQERAKVRAYADTPGFAALAPATIRRTRQLLQDWDRFHTRTWLTPPPDCKRLDSYGQMELMNENSLALTLLTALELDQEVTARLLVRTARDAVTRFPQSNIALCNAYAARRLRAPWQFKTGPTASMLGQLTLIAEHRYPDAPGKSQSPVRGSSRLPAGSRTPVSSVL